jgi:hypothetical protein
MIIRRELAEEEPVYFSGHRVPISMGLREEVDVGRSSALRRGGRPGRECVDSQPSRISLSTVHNEDVANLAEATSWRMTSSGI